MSEPTCKIDGDENKFWRLPDGRLHRLDGPAAEFSNGTKWWCVNDRLHREDGPAITYPGDKMSWFFNNEKVKVNSQEEFERELPYLQIKQVIDE